MSFRLVPNSVTLNGVIAPNLSYFTGVHYVKVVEDTPTLSADKESSFLTPSRL